MMAEDNNEGYKERLKLVLWRYGTAVVVGKTGCGKTTIVPAWLALEDKAKHDKRPVLVAVPRRLPATSAARRVRSNYGYTENDKTVEITVISEADIFIQGYDSSIEFNTETVSPYSTFYHTYEVKLVGYTSIYGAIVDFKVPRSFVAQTGHETTKVDIGEPVTTINSLHSTLTCYGEYGKFQSFHLSRSGNAGGLGSEKEIKDDGDDDEELKILHEVNSSTTTPDLENVKLGGMWGRKSNNQLNIDCDDDSKTTVNCMDVRCRITNMVPGTIAMIRFPIRMDSNNLRVILKKKFGSINYKSSGRVEIIGVTDDIQPINHLQDSSAASTLIESAKAKSVSHLIYLLGVIIGLLVLSAIVYCLYKMDCFKREKPIVSKNPEETDPLRDQREMKKLDDEIYEDDENI